MSARPFFTPGMEDGRQAMTLLDKKL